MDLLNLEVDLLSFDTTSIYFEAKEADEKVLRDWRGRKLPPGTTPMRPARLLQRFRAMTSRT